MQKTASIQAFFRCIKPRNPKGKSPNSPLLIRPLRTKGLTVDKKAFQARKSQKAPAHEKDTEARRVIKKPGEASLCMNGQLETVRIKVSMSHRPIRFFVYLLKRDDDISEPVNKRLAV